MRRLITIAGVAALIGAVLPLRLDAQSLERDTFAANRCLPDGNAAGLSETRTLNSGISRISSVKVGLKITGEFNGDLYAYLRHAGHFAVLLNRSGKSSTDPAGYPDSGLDVTLEDDSSSR